MKQFAFMLTLSLISVFSLQAQSTPAKSEDGAKISFDKEVVDYGTIKQGADPLRTFKFKNTSSIFHRILPRTIYLSKHIIIFK